MLQIGESKLPQYTFKNIYLPCLQYYGVGTKWENFLDFLMK